jgi:hypothetical protein
MTPDKVSRHAVTIRRFWTGVFGLPNDYTKIRPIRLVQSFETRKDAEAACRQLRHDYPHWADQGLRVFDLAECILQPECLMSDSSAHYDRVCAAYDEHQAKQGSSAAPTA